MPWLKVNGMSVHVRMDKRQSEKMRCGNCRRHTLDKRLCDWKMPGGKDCDRPICEFCTVSPAPDKDLCPEHAAAWAVHPKNPAARGPV
jgi:hypothetical protein